MHTEITTGTTFESTTNDTRYTIVREIERNDSVFIISVSVKMNDGTWKVTNTSARFRWTQIQQNMNDGRWFLADVPENYLHSLENIFDC